MAVRIRMKMMGRAHRPYFRIVAIDSHSPQFGRVLEELGSYDPMVPETDARVILNNERVAYWLSVGALPTEKVGTLIKKYGPNGTCLAQQQAALERLASKKRRVVVQPRPRKVEEAPTVEAPAAEAPAAE